MSFALLSVLLFLMFWVTFCMSVTVNKVQKKLAEAVSLTETVRCGHCPRSQTCIRQYDGYISQCSELHLLKETRIALDKKTSKTLVLQQLTSRDCSQFYERGYRSSGIYPMWLKQGYRFASFYCDMDTTSELTNKLGWTVLQKRFNGIENFDRNWNEYAKGFGTLDGEHWVGLENIFSLTNQMTAKLSQLASKTPRLRLDLEDWDGLVLYAEINGFAIATAEQQYYIFEVGPAHGSATYIPLKSVSLYQAEFSTVDNDNTDRKCPHKRKGGWWFPRTCGLSNLNGHYSKRKSIMKFPYIYWHNWPNDYGIRTALRRVSMKVQH